MDSMNSQDPDQPLSPWRTLQWALKANGSILTLVDPEPKAGPKRAAAPQFRSKRKELAIRNGIPIAYYLFRTAGV